MRASEQIVRAAELATRAHGGQSRKGIDEPFVFHPMRVAVAAEDCGLSLDAIAAAYLHDVVEDTDVTRDHLIDAGFHGETIHLVGLLTKWWNDEFVLTSEGLREALRPSEVHRRIRDEFKPAYYAKIATEPEAVCLKLLDRADNLNDMVRTVVTERKWAAKYYEKTCREVSPLLDLCCNEEVTRRYNAALWALEKALAVQSMADGLRPSLPVEEV